MKLLLDTHVFLWFISGDTKLKPEHRAAIEDANNEVYFSVASVWEAVIKSQLASCLCPSPLRSTCPSSGFAIESRPLKSTRRPSWNSPSCR